MRERDRQTETETERERERERERRQERRELAVFAPHPEPVSVALLLAQVQERHAADRERPLRAPRPPSSNTPKAEARMVGRTANTRCPALQFSQTARYSIQPVESLPDYASLTTEVPTPPTDARPYHVRSAVPIEVCTGSLAGVWLAQ